MFFNVTPISAQRDPIAGKGDFGDREWDPIWKYNGRVRRARSSTGRKKLLILINISVDVINV